MDWSELLKRCDEAAQALSAATAWAYAGFVRAAVTDVCLAIGAAIVGMYGLRRGLRLIDSTNSKPGGWEKPSGSNIAAIMLIVGGSMAVLSGILGFVILLDAATGPEWAFTQSILHALRFGK